MKRWMLAAPVAALALGAGAQKSDRPEVPKDWRVGYDTINADDASKIVHHLAGPQYNGRGAASPDFEKAARWCADWMKANGILPGAPNGSYFQPFHIERRSVNPASAKILVDGEDAGLVFGTDYVFQAEADYRQKLKVAFIRLPKGTAITSLDWKKFKGHLVIVHPDTAADPASDFQTISSSEPPVQTGAFAVVSAGMPGALRAAPITRIRESRDPVGPIRNFRMTLDGARALARAVEADGFAAQHNDRPGVEFGEAEFVGEFQAEPWVTTMNVVGKIPGDDPALSKQAIVIGAHLDHMGVRNGATYWGADDNASGSGAALMIGRALAANPVKPKRTVLIGLWSSEELGLYGSRMYASNPSMPMENTVAYLNMDMVGRDAEYAPFGDLPENNRNAVYIGSAEFSSPELYRFLKDKNKYVGLNLRDDKNDRTRRSDTGSFYDKGVPVLKAFTGEHKDYHKPTDTPDKVNYPKMTNVARWLYLSTSELAASAWRPSFDTNARLLVGKANVMPKANFSSEAVFYATLVECNVDGSSPMVIDRTSQHGPGQAPFSFALKYHTTRIDPHKLYVVRTSVFDHGKLMHKSKAGLRVLTYNHPADNIVVMMEPRGNALEGTTTKQQR